MKPVSREVGGERMVAAQGSVRPNAPRCVIRAYMEFVTNFWVNRFPKIICD